MTAHDRVKRSGYCVWTIEGAFGSGFCFCFCSDFRCTSEMILRNMNESGCGEGCDSLSDYGCSFGYGRSCSDCG